MWRFDHRNTRRAGVDKSLLESSDMAGDNPFLPVRHRSSQELRKGSLNQRLHALLGPEVQGIERVELRFGERLLGLGALHIPKDSGWTLVRPSSMLGLVIWKLCYQF